ncbi:11895_t:CDS:2, partial [Acaulospora colombiana]
MAKAGFICASSIHNPDNVMCVYCDVSLGDWEQKDDPMKEHRKRFPSCPFFDKPPLKAKKQKDAEKVITKRTRRQKVEQVSIVNVEEDEMETLDRMVGHLTLGENSGRDSKQIIRKSTSIGMCNDAVIEDNREVPIDGRESRGSTSTQRKTEEKSNSEVDEVESLGLGSIQSMNLGGDDILFINNDSTRNSSVLRYNNEVVIIEDDENRATDLPVFQKDLEIKENRQQATSHPQQNNVIMQRDATERSVENVEHEMLPRVEKDDTNVLKFVVEKEIVEDFNYELLGIIDDGECDELLAETNSANDECK